MKKLTYLAASTLALSAVATPASAAEFIFNFTTQERLIGQAVSGNGIFTTSDTAMTVGGRTAFSILSLSGFVNGSAITAPLGGGFGPGGTYGNYFTTGSSFLDGSGTRFFTASGIDVRFFQQSSNGRDRVNTFGAFGSSNYVTATSSQVMAAVPEPATWLMMLLGFGAIGFSMRSKKRSATRVQFA